VSRTPRAIAGNLRTTRRRRCSASRRREQGLEVSQAGGDRAEPVGGRHRIHPITAHELASAHHRLCAGRLPHSIVSEVLAVMALIGCSFEIALRILPTRRRAPLVDDTAVDFESPSERIDVTTPKRGVIRTRRVRARRLADGGLCQAIPAAGRCPDVGSARSAAAGRHAQRRRAHRVRRCRLLDRESVRRGAGHITDNFTIIYRGELYLPRGRPRSKLASDGPSLLEIAAGADGTYGTRMFARRPSPVLTPRVDVSALQLLVPDSAPRSPTRPARHGSVP